MRIVALIFGLVCCLGVALDAFQTMILPRRPAGRLRITRLFFFLTWGPWCWVAGRTENKKFREQIFGTYGPLSLLMLLGLWGLLLVTGFALFYFALGSPFTDAMQSGDTNWLAHLRTDLYVSGTTLFTLGLGDIVPHAHAARVLVVMESGVGLGFMAVVIGYLPVLYQAFSRREVSVALLDARAGSPPTATELLRRHGFEGGHNALSELLAEWERWSAEMLETHISYPILCYYRSQHDNQSWLSALVAILDSCALLISIVEGTPARQAQLTFAIGRHVLIDLGHVFRLEKKAVWCKAHEAEYDRLPPEAFAQLCDALGEVTIRICGDSASAQRLHTIRALYEPYAQALAEYLHMPLPAWIPEPDAKDQWRIIAKLRGEAEAVLSGSGLATARRLHDEHH
jgi:hypothetical protein